MLVARNTAGAPVPDIPPRVAPAVSRQPSWLRSTTGRRPKSKPSTFLDLGPLWHETKTTSLRQDEADAQDPGKVPLQAVRSVR